MLMPGELSIPTGTFEVLRIKSEIQRTDSLIMHLGLCHLIQIHRNSMAGPGKEDSGASNT